MSIVVVNFHYVGMPERPFDGIHGLSVPGFADAVSELARRYELISLSDLLRKVGTGRDAVAGDLCLITFDDGLRSQFEEALPILEKQHAPAAFFIPTGPLATGIGTTIHKLHWARASFGDDAISKTLRELNEAGEIKLPPGNAAFMKKVRESYRYDTEGAALLKFTMNYLLAEDEARRVLTRFMLESGMTEQDFVAELYMDARAVRELGRRGYVGSHAVSHRPLAKLSLAAAEQELRTSKEFLEGLTGAPVQAVSYPLGNESAVSYQVAQAAARCGYAVGLTMERARNVTAAEQLLLARCDAADIPILDSLSGRRRYYDETSFEKQPAMIE